MDRMNVGPPNGYDDLNSFSSDDERLNVVFNILAKEDDYTFIDHSKLFISPDREHLFNAKLKITGLVDYSENTNRLNPAFKLNQKSVTILEKYGSYLKYMDSLRAIKGQKVESEADKQTLELEKLKGENKFLSLELGVYSQLKQQNMILIFIAIAEFLAILILGILQFK